jgi:trans-aconitate methyltransferase
VDSEAPANEIREHLRRHRRQWEANAKLDALWAILAFDDKFGDGWNERAFFQTGEQEIEEVFHFMQRSHIAAPPDAKALDFGCGVGRVTQSLAARVSHVVGVDISREMIRRARSYFPTIAFHLNEKDELSDFETESIDLIYTNIVLQHLNADLQAHYIREFSRLLRPEGMVILQIPSRRALVTRKRFRILRMLASLRLRNVINLLGRSVRKRVVPWQAKIELNVIPKTEVIRIAGSCGLTVEAIGNINWKTLYTHNDFRLEPESNELEDQPEFPLSHLYFFRKAAAAVIT